MPRAVASSPLALLVAAALAGPALAQQEADGPALAADAAEALRRRLDAQQRDLEALRREVERLRAGQAARPAEGGDPSQQDGPDEPGGASASSGADDPRVERSWGPYRTGPFWISGWHGAWKLELTGRLQTDARFVLDPDRGDVADTFLVRRARFGFELTLYEVLRGELTMEFGRTEDADLRDGFLTLDLGEWLELSAGQMLLPYSPQRLTSSRLIDHAERAMIVSELVGDRDVGVLLHGTLPGGYARYALGTFNGEGQNVRRNAAEAFDLVGRLELLPFGDETLRLGASLIHSPPERDDEPELEAVRTVGDQLTPFLVYRIERRRGLRQRVEGDVRLVLAPFVLDGELHVDRHERLVSQAGRESDLTQWGWFVGANLVVGGDLDPAEYGLLVTPTRPLFAPRSRRWGPGALQLSLRYEEFRADPRTVERGFAEGAELARAVTASLHWYLWREVRLTASYTYTDLDRGYVVLPDERVVDEHALIVRFALWF